MLTCIMLVLTGAVLDQAEQVAAGTGTPAEYWVVKFIINERCSENGAPRAPNPSPSGGTPASTGRGLRPFNACFADRGPLSEMSPPNLLTFKNQPLTVLPVAAANHV